MLSPKSIITEFTKRAGKIDKRYRLVISVLIMVAIMLTATFFSLDKAIYFLPVMALVSYFLAFFCILEEIEHVGWFGFFFMPVVATIFLYLEYFLLPGRWLTRLPFIIIYGISIYAILLTSNIFNVGVEKSLQLYRAAFSVNYFYQAFIVFIAFNFLLSLQLNPFINMICVGIITFFFSFHLLWTIRLKKYIEPEVLKFAFLIGLILGQIGLILSFIPLKPTSSSLFLASSYYSLLGIIYHFLDSRLFKETIREYIFVWIFVLGITLLSINW
jgi:hypothetical protein